MTYFRTLNTAPVITRPIGEGDGRTVTVRVVSWEQPYDVTDDGLTYYREQFAPDGLTARGTVLVRTEHDPSDMAGRPLPGGASSSPGVTVGRAVEFRSERDGLYADIRIARTRDGDDLLALIEDGIVGAVSSEFDDAPVRPVDGELITRTEAELVGIAFTTHPQHPDASVVAVRSQPAQEANNMDNQNTADETAGTDTPITPSDDTTTDLSADPTPDPVPATRSAPQPRVAPVPNARTSQYRSFADFTRAVALGELHGEQQARYFRALDAAVSGTDATGLVTEQWIRQVGDLVRAFTPSVNSWNRLSLPDTGMTVSLPLVTVAPTLAVQATQNTEVESTALTVTPVQYTVKTYAGGQNTSIQTIERSEPAYLQVLMGQYVKYMAKTLNLAVATQLLTDADDVNTTSLEYVTANTFPDLIVDASAVFLDTLGRPAEVVGMSVDLFKALAKAKDTNGDFPLFPVVNPMGTSGTVGARTTSGTIIEVDFYVDPDLGGVGDGITGVIGVREAFNVMTGPLGTLNADVPSTLGRDTAVYQMAAFGKLDATGLYKIVDAV